MDFILSHSLSLTGFFSVVLLTSIRSYRSDFKFILLENQQVVELRMERGDLKYLWLASQLNNQFKSDELIEATKDFSRSLAFAPTSWNMIPINDRLLYRIHVINYKINFLNALKGLSAAD